MTDIGARRQSAPGQTRLPWPVWLAVAALLCLVAGAILPFGMFGFAGARSPGLVATLNDPYIWRAVRFTVWQAALSTLLSVVIALPVAIALHADRRFWGRGLVLRLFALPLALPQIVAALAITGLYGRRGFLTGMLGEVGIDLPSIYGLTGILIAHSFFNAPLAARIMAGALDTMPPEYEKIAANLNMSLLDRTRLLYWPSLRASLAGSSALIFLLCATSFTVVLVLGGGPAATTLEVAIYQALTFDFDVSRALILTFLQVVLTLLAVKVFSMVGTETSSGMMLSPAENMRPMAGPVRRFRAPLIVAPLALYVLAPFLVIIWKGIAADLASLASDAAFLRATATSLILGSAAASVSVALAWALSTGIARLAAARRFTGAPKHTEGALTDLPSLILVLPPIVLAAGWFLTLRPVVDVYAAAPWLVIAINAAMAMPFAMRLMLPAVKSLYERHHRLCQSLGINGWNRIRVIEWPVLMRPVLAAFAFAFALSLGDLGVIALFGSQDVQTLPYLILQRMGSYRTNDADGLALLLMLLTMALMFAVDSAGRRRTMGHG